MLSKSSILAPTALVRLGRGADLAASKLAQSLKTPLQFLSFWGAIGLPFVQLSLLADGIQSSSAAVLFLALLVTNIVALYVGHGYKQP